MNCEDCDESVDGSPSGSCCGQCQEWVPAPIKCRVRDSIFLPWHERLITHIRDGIFYVDTTGYGWNYAEPIPVWGPQPGEWVGFFDVIDQIIIRQYKCKSGNAFIDTTGTSWVHVLRLKDDDGNSIDLGGGIEAVKERTQWL